MDSVSSLAPAVKYDGLVSHLVAKHHQTLRLLDFGQHFVGHEVLKEVCERCVFLEELTVGCGRIGLVNSYQFFLSRN